ncbi:MAG: hypothetical protein RLY14_2639, partial [Planctomycetota bacterium]
QLSNLLCSFRNTSLATMVLATCFAALSTTRLSAEIAVPTVQQALQNAGDNRAQLEKALTEISPEQKPGLEFLLRHMPEHDLQSLTCDYLLQNVRLAYQAWKESPWHSQVDEELFFNNILPYCVVNETRDEWRKDFYERFRPLIADCKTISEAAATLNGQIFGIVQVKYSTKRPKPDQSPAESIKAGLASCSGLSILLIDACRALGIPARFAGTPLWADGSGNHSWVEIWDNGQWHFTGACEATGKELNQGWFTGRASQAIIDDPRKAIYASSFKRTPIHFPLVWDRQIRFVYAVNVTPRYAGKQTIPDGMMELMFVARSSQSKSRLAIELTIEDQMSGQLISKTSTRDERFDANDHVSIVVPSSGSYKVIWQDGSQTRSLDIHGKPEKLPIELEVSSGK